MTELVFIKTSKAFKYSVNIKYDLGDFEKINSFIPTEKNVELFKDVFSSFKKNPTTRARILTGAYGTGKSFFGMVLGSILSFKDKSEKFSDFLSKISKIDSSLTNNIEKELYNKPPYLLVLPSTNYKTFTQALYNGVKNSLERENLTDKIFPETNFSAVKTKISQWKNEYPETFKDFKTILKIEKATSLDDFLNSINEYDKEAYDFFTNVYPDLTSGGEFDPYSNSKLSEVYEEICNEIKKLGYQGIYIIFDEFNKLLENDIEKFDGKVLQDFAEMASRTEENEIHLLLLSHKDLVQYTTNLTQKQTDEWKKIEKRFKILEAINYSSKIYDLIGAVICKETSDWNNFIEAQKSNIDFYAKKADDLELFPSLNAKEIKNKIVKDCYPLHPLVTNLLPKLAQRIGQNERTLFTFLSTQEKNTLGDFVKSKHEQEYPLIDLEYVYNYFKELMQQELEYSSIYEAWSDVQIALQKVGKNDKDKTKFLKSLAVIHALKNFSEISPSKQILKFALDHVMDDEKFEEIFAELIESKIIIERKSINQVTFFDGSEVDINELVDSKIRQNINSFNPLYLLNELYSPPPVYPKKYNDEFKIRRYFASQYIYPNDLNVVDDWEDYLKNYNASGYIDGVINYIIWNGKTEKAEIIENVKKVSNERIIFVLPDEPVKINDLLRRLDSLLMIKKDKKLLEKDKLIEKEINAFIKEIKLQIENRLDNKLIVNPSRQLFNKGELISSKINLSKLTSKICSSSFTMTPKINNELLVKNKITSPQKKARKKVVEEILVNGLNERLNISGYGPDYLIYISFFRSSRLDLVCNKNDDIKFCEDLSSSNYGELDNNYKNIIVKIKENLFNKEKEVNLGELYDELRSPPYGIRLGIIPILIAIAGRIDNDIDHAIIKHNGEERKIEASLFEEINNHPHRFSISRLDWNTHKEKYISYLEDLFFNNDKANRNSINRVERVYSSIENWLINLPNYSKETKENLSENTILLRRLIMGQRKEAKTLLLQYIPQKTITNSEIEWKEITYKKLKKIFSEFHRELQNAYSDLKRQIFAELTKKIFISRPQQSLFSNEFKNSLLNWKENLKEETINHTFDRKTNSFLQLIENIKINDLTDNEILEEMSLIITGFKLEDWNDNIKEEFINQVGKVKSKVDNYDNRLVQDDNWENNQMKFELYFDDDMKLVRTFSAQNLDGIAKILDKQVRQTIKDIGNNISAEEKQQILTYILKDIAQSKL